MYQASDPNHCPVHLFEKYVGLLPKGGVKSDFYMHPLTKYTPHQWYAEWPVGLNTLRCTVKCMVTEAGLPGKFTNHSLHATAVTWIYQEGVPEKLIKEITGHLREAVHDYERTGDKLKHSVSAALGTNPENKCKVSTKHSKSMDFAEELKCEEGTGTLTQVIQKFAKEEKVHKINFQIEYEDK